MTIVIDSTTYDVDIIDLDETLEFLDKYAERTEDGVLHRELIGTFPKQSLRFGTPQTAAERADRKRYTDEKWLRKVEKWTRDKEQTQRRIDWSNIP